MICKIRGQLVCIYLPPLLISSENSRCRTVCPHPLNPTLQLLESGKVARPGGEDGIFIPLWWRASGMASSPENRFRECGENLVETRQCRVREGYSPRKQGEKPTFALKCPSVLAGRGWGGVRLTNSGALRVNSNINKISPTFGKLYWYVFPK
jgi:hypothetical protein